MSFMVRTDRKKPPLRGTRWDRPMDLENIEFHMVNMQLDMIFLLVLLGVVDDKFYSGCFDRLSDRWIQGHSINVHGFPVKKLP